MRLGIVQGMYGMKKKNDMQLSTRATKRYSIGVAPDPHRDSRDEGLALIVDSGFLDTAFIRDMEVPLQQGDEVEVTVRVVSRLETKRVKL